MNIYTALLACFLGIQYYISQVSDQSSERNEFDTAIANHVVDHDLDSLETRMFACNPPFQVMGLYDPNVPLSPNTAIFADPLVKAEIMSDGIQGMDKEYGDIDNDGLIDILYTKNNELWYITNTGTLSVPDYQVSNAVQTLFTNVFSFRIVDWFNDGVLDLLLLEDHGIRQINLYSNIHSQLSAPASIGLIDDTQFPLRFDQLIEAGDVDGDGDMDVLVSGQDFGLAGTAFLEQLQGAPPFFFPYLQLGANQTLPTNVMIPDNGGSYHAPEMYDADCDGDLDLFISDPLLLTAGGHVDYYENTGSGSPLLYFTQQSANPYGLVDIPGDDLRCDFVILRFVDFFGDGCPEAISYNPCNMTTDPNGEIFYYKNNCSCEADFNFALDTCQQFQFYDNSSSSGTLTYNWNFGDPASGPNNSSTLQDPTHQFSGCGTYNVCLTINGPMCNATICHNVQTNDNIPPVITCPGNIYLTAPTSDCSMVVNGLQWVTLFDDCSMPSVTYTVTGASSYVGLGDASGLVFNQGVSIVNYVATDHCGNTANCNFAVVIDCICSCSDNIVLNGGFNLGASPGILGINGNSNSWTASTGSPEIIAGDYCCEDFAIQMGGNQNGGESVCQSGLNFIYPLHAYTISFCARYIPNSTVPYVNFGFTASTDCTSSPYNCTNCEVIGNSVQISNPAWTTYTLPVWSPSQSWTNLNIKAFNTSIDTSWGMIDNICIEEVVYRCCKDENTFIDNVQNNIEFLTDTSLRKVTFMIGNIPGCDVVKYVDWGDGNRNEGNFQSGQMLMHIYAEAGNFSITYLVSERNDLTGGDQVCFERIFNEDINLRALPICPCPNGNIPGNNLVVNGDFSAGNVNFLSQYLFNFGYPLPYGSYIVGNNPPASNPAFQPCIDHTTGSGKMLIANGKHLSDYVWRQIVPVTPNTTYTFSVWASSLTTTSPAFISISIDGLGFVPAVLLSNTPCLWQEICGTFFSGNRTSVYLGIQDINVSQNGNDFAIDDISLRACNPPCQASFAFNPTLTCGNINFTNTSTNLPPDVQYCWDFDGNPGTCESTSPNASMQFLPCNTYNVCLTISGTGCSSTSCQNVTVTDTTPPVALCSGIGLELDANCSVVVSPNLIDDGSSDDCGIQSMTVSPSTLTGCGFFPVTLTVTDFCGNSSTCTTLVQTAEAVPPTITCPPDITFNTSWPNCSRVVNGLQWLSVNDNCGVQSITYTVTGASSYAGTNDASGLVYNPGVSTVTYTAIDLCGNETTCAFDVSISCDSLCVCGAFQHMFIRTGGGASQQIFCGGAPIMLSCPPIGNNYEITGAFDCVGGVCPDKTEIHWVLTGPGITQTGTSTSPLFGISLSSLYFVQPGLYTLTMNGFCGGASCPCVVQFMVDCPDPCPCDPIDFASDLNSGLITYSNFRTCNTCIRPKALNDCDMVEWSIDGGPVVAMTSGLQSYCSVLTRGFHSVKATVTRKRTDGTICATGIITQNFNVYCIGQRPNCRDNVIFNPGFDLDAVAGSLNEEGELAGWYSPYGNPLVKEGIGIMDEWSVMLNGNADSADVLAVQEPICWEKDQGTIRMMMISGWQDSVTESHPIPDPREALHIRLYRGIITDPVNDPCQSEDCYELLNLPHSDLTSNEWYAIEFPYDLRDWMAEDPCGGVLVTPVIYVTNGLWTIQGADTKSSVIVDWICIERAIVGIENQYQNQRVQIFPNPTTGRLNIEFDEPVQSDLNIQVINFTGQTVLKEKIDMGEAIHTIETDQWSSGMYFIQIISDNQILSVNRFVKM